MDKILPLISVLLLVAGCTAEIDNQFGSRASAPRDKAVFQASVEECSTPDTKVYADENMKVLWNADDRISIFNMTTGNAQYAFTGDDGDTAGGFEWVSEDESGDDIDYVYAVYPYQARTTVGTDGVITTTLPEKQLYKEHSFGIGTNTMVAVTDANFLAFKNVGGYLSLRLYGDNISVRRITIRGNNGEKIAGKASIAMPFGGTPTVTMDDTATDVVSIVCDPAVKLGESVDSYTDFWFVIPPVTFEKGFTITVIDELGGVFEKSTSKFFTVSRNTLDWMNALKVVPDYNVSDLRLEREALMDFYYAMDGPNWNDNTNWGSDLPFDQWVGLYVDPYGEGNVTGIYFDENNMSGAVPASLAGLKQLSVFRLVQSSNPIDFSGICGATSLGTVYLSAPGFTIPENIGNLKNLGEFYAYGPCGTIPESFFDLANLDWCVFTNAAFGPLPNGFSKLKKLRGLYIYGIGGGCTGIDVSASMAGPIPDDLYDCTSLQHLVIAYTGINGELSPKIKNLKNLAVLELYDNKLSGPLPVELTEIDILHNLELYGGVGDAGVWLFGNEFSGKVPAEFKDWSAWSRYWGYITSDALDISDCLPRMLDFEVTTINGEQYSTSDIYNNELTIFFQWDTNCEFVPDAIKALKKLYSSYHGKELEIVSWSFEDEETIIPYVQEQGVPGICFSNWADPMDPWPMGMSLWPNNFTPIAVVYDSKGDLVYYSLAGIGDLTGFVEDWFNKEMYESTDYSADGNVHTLKTATQGNGINIVLMGDTFSDRLIADGTYDAVMRRAMNALFSEEPYKSYKDYFNVYSVDVVSKNEYYKGTSALSTWYGEGTTVGGDDGKVFEYARKALMDSQMDDALIIVMMNRDYYAGTCYMYNVADGDYGRGASIAYFPASSEDATFAGQVLHEAGGHGFAKLADEYFYCELYEMSEEASQDYQSKVPYGWYKNIDITYDSNAVKWAKFLTDSRYSNEGLGIYEGAFTFSAGVFRPTENSIMNDNTGGFNAPSREAIWYRIGKLANGDNWEGSYEDFVAYDAINRSAAMATKASRPNYVTRSLPKSTPPVIVNRSWREVADHSATIR